MAAEIKEENLSLALRFIVDRFGKEALLNQEQLNAILPDLLSNKFQTETSWIMDAINSGIVNILLNPSNTNEQAIDKAKDVFEKHYVAEIRKEYVLDCLSYALGWTNEKVQNLDDYKIKKNKPKTKLKLEKEVTRKENKNNNYQNNQQNNNYQNNQRNNKKKEPDYDKLIKQQKKSYNRENTNNQHNNLNNQNHNQYQNNNSNGNKKKLLLLLIPILLVLGILGAKLSSGSEDVKISDFYFNPQPELSGTTYIIEEYETVQLNIVFDIKNEDKIDKDKITYSIDDNSVCNYQKETYNRCIITGIGEGITTIRIYYDNEEIKSINIGVGDIEDDGVFVESIYPSSNVQKNGSSYVLPVGENVEFKVALRGEDIDEDEISYSLDDLSLADLTYNGKKCTLYGKNAGYTVLRIKYDNEEIYTVNLTFEESSNSENENTLSDSNSEVDLVVKAYLENYGNAINFGDIGYISSYLTSSGKFYKELSKSIPKTYDKGTKVDVVGYTKGNMKKEGNKYRVPMTIEYNIYKEDDGLKYQKEYMEFIVVQSAGEWLIDHYDNWKLLEQRDI